MASRICMLVAASALPSGYGASIPGRQPLLQIEMKKCSLTARSQHQTTVQSKSKWSGRPRNSAAIPSTRPAALPPAVRKASGFPAKPASSLPPLGWKAEPSSRAEGFRAETPRKGEAFPHSGRQSRVEMLPPGNFDAAPGIRRCSLQLSHAFLILPDYRVIAIPQCRERVVSGNPVSPKGLRAYLTTDN
jgi:hypothetical protein